MNLPKFFLIGGAKGVGKTVVTAAVALETGLERIETGKIVFDYLGSARKLGLNDYICERIMDFGDRNLIIDTHYVAYPHREGMDRSFRRGLDTVHIQKLAQFYDIHLAHIVLSSQELLKRRQRDQKKRVTNFELVEEELGFSEKACELYAKELNRSPLVIENCELINTKEILKGWILTILSGQQQQ